MRSQIIDVFIIELNIDINLVSLVPWRLYVGGLVCSNDQVFGIAFMSPDGAVLKPHHAQNIVAQTFKAAYVLFGLELLLAIGATHIEAFGVSLLVALDFI